MPEHFWIAVEWVLMQPNRDDDWKTDMLRRLGAQISQEA